MQAPQQTPPGHLELHVVLVAATPALLVLIGGVATAIAGGGRAARLLGWCCMLSGLSLLALFLRPGGVAAAYTYPIGHQWLRVGPWQSWAALASGSWGMLAWRPRLVRGRAGAAHAIGWGLRGALCLLTPLTLIPLGPWASEWDAQRALPWTPVGRWRGRRRLLVVALGILAMGIVCHYGGDAWAGRSCMAGACLISAATTPWRWVPPALLAGMAALAPLAT